MWVCVRENEWGGGQLELWPGRSSETHDSPTVKSVCPSAELWLTRDHQREARRRWEVGKEGERKKAAKGLTHSDGINTPTPLLIHSYTRPQIFGCMRSKWCDTLAGGWRYGGVQNTVWQSLPGQRETQVPVASSAACWDSSPSFPVHELIFLLKGLAAKARQHQESQIGKSSSVQSYLMTTWINITKEWNM